MKRFLLIIPCITLSLHCLAAGIHSGPWVTETRTDRITVLWTSDRPGMAYVELEDGTKVWETFAGRRIFRRLHRIRIDGLAPGSTLRYRACGVELADDSNARDPRFGDSYEGSWHRVRTFDPKARGTRFSVFNDIHLQTAKYSALASAIDSAATDFIFLNGDIVTAGNYVLDTLVKYAIDPLGDLPAGIPLLFARGNHEGRGNNPGLVSEVFQNGEPAPFYYTFRQGPVAFLVLDAGETNRNRSVLYSGTEVYEEYIGEQMEWVRKAVREPSFRRAPMKICLLHVPMIDHEDKDGYHTQRWLNRHVLPLLNKAGIDLMIGADLHEAMLCDPGSMGNRFPILVNDDARRLDFSCEKNAIHIETFNADGVKEFEWDFRP